jgi:hypothetical protein
MVRLKAQREQKEYRAKRRFNPTMVRLKGGFPTATSYVDQASIPQWFD